MLDTNGSYCPFSLGTLAIIPTFRAMPDREHMLFIKKNVHVFIFIITISTCKRKNSPPNSCVHIPC